MKKLLFLLFLSQYGFSGTVTTNATGGSTCVASSVNSTGEKCRLSAKVGETVSWAHSGTATMTIQIQESSDASNWKTVQTISKSGDSTDSGTIDIEGTSSGKKSIRLNVSSYTSGSATLTLADVDDLVQEFKNKKGIRTLRIGDDYLTVGSGIKFNDGSILVSSPSAGGGGTPGGSNTQVQFNNAGAFDGASGLVYSSGNVGIGSTSPAAKLNIVDTNSTANVSRRVSQTTLTDSGATTNTAGQTRIVNYSSGVFTGNFTSGGSSLVLGSNELFISYSGTINSNGDSNDLVLFGQRVTPTFTGTVADAADSLAIYSFTTANTSNAGTTGGVVKYGYHAIVAGTADSNIGFYSNVSEATSNYNFYAEGSSLNYFGGNVGIGTTSPASQLHTTGTVRFANFGAGTATFDASGNISSASDERLKDIKGDFKAGVDQLAKIKPILYKWNKKSGLEMNSVYAGFSAQNVQKTIPEAVGKNRDGMLSLQDRALLAAAINGIKELNSRLKVIEEKFGIKN